MAVPSLPENLHTLMYAAEIEAGLKGRIKVATIRKWVQRGHLEVARRDARGRPQFRYLDVAKAELATRERARRVWPAA